MFKMLQFVNSTNCKYLTVQIQSKNKDNKKKTQQQNKTKQINYCVVDSFNVKMIYGLRLRV